MEFVSVEELNQRIEEEFTGVCVYDVTSSEVIKDFQNIVDECTHIGWVSVKGKEGRFPDETGDYLVYGKWDRSGKTVIDIVDFSKDDGYFRTAWNFDVTHWMPLPSTEELDDNR